MSASLLLRIVILLLSFHRQQLHASAGVAVMLTSPLTHKVDIDKTVLRLDCQFQMDDFTYFVNPIFWRKSQLDDEPVVLNLQGNILEPFLSTKRFNAELASSSNKRRYNPQLTIYGVRPEDSGNYTCEVHGRKSTILASVTHLVHVAAPLKKICFAVPMDSSLTDTLYDVTDDSSPTLSDDMTSLQDQRVDFGLQAAASDSYSFRLNCVHDVNATAGQPTPLRCVADGSGFPSPDLRVTIGTRDVTMQYFRQTTTAFFESDSGQGDISTVGLRVIKYRTELIADGLVVEANDDGATVRCLSTSSQQSPPSGRVNEAETFMEDSAHIELHVFHAPRIVCIDTVASIGDHEVFLRCEVTARPQPTALYWQLQQLSPNDTSDSRINSSPPPSGDYLDSDGYFWTVATDRSDGCLETRLYIGKVVPHSFRSYTVVAENSIGTNMNRVRLIQASVSRHLTDDRRTQHQMNRGSPSKKSTSNGDDNHYDETDDVAVSGHADDVNKHNGVQRHSFTDMRSQMSYMSSSPAQVASLSLAASLLLVHFSPACSTLVGHLLLASLSHLNCASEPNS